MKKFLCLLTALILLLSLAACGSVSEGPTAPSTGDPTAPPSSDSNMAANTCPCSVMVDGELFFTYFEKADIDPETVQPAGTITHASCDISATPKENDTSNFETCVGQPYAWIDGDLILFYQNRWNVCYRTDEVGGSYKIMVNGILYYTFSKPAPTPTDDEIAGNIETCTEGLWVYPTENDQTNHEPFVGQPYAFVGGELVLFYNDQWNTCKPFGVLEPSETQPTEAVISEWTPMPFDSLSYSEYLSENHPASNYCISLSWTGQDDKTEYVLEYTANGWDVLNSGDLWSPLWTIPESDAYSGITLMLCDGEWAYGTRNQTELIRVELLTGTIEVLFTADRMMCRQVSEHFAQNAALVDRNWLYFLAKVDDCIGIYRLYLPDMHLDLLADDIPGNTMPYALDLQVSPETQPLVSCVYLNPEIQDLVLNTLEDPDSAYRNTFEFTGDFQGSPAVIDLSPAWTVPNPSNVLAVPIQLDFLVIRLQQDYDIPAKRLISFHVQTGEKTNLPVRATPIFGYEAIANPSFG